MIDDQLIDEIMESNLVVELEIDALRAENAILVEEVKEQRRVMKNMETCIFTRDNKIDSLNLLVKRYKEEAEEMSERYDRGTL